MARCSHPIYAVDLGLKDNGKRNIKILPVRVDQSSLKQLSQRYGKANILPLPCGKCINCKINQANEWAVRCVLESLCHEENWFLTLTFNDAHLPKDKKSCREVIQKFFKRLRSDIGKFRYFGCLEQGSKLKRYHFHLILFGAKLDDIRPNRFGYMLSDHIAKAWTDPDDGKPLGLYNLGEVTYASCNYVAQYSVKKIFGDNTERFLMMSNRPGIGYSWLIANLNKIWAYDQVFGSFGDRKSSRLPRYFDKVAELIDPERFAQIKLKRAESESLLELHEMLVHGFDEAEKLLEYKENITLHEFINKKRGVRLDL